MENDMTSTIEQAPPGVKVTPPASVAKAERDAKQAEQEQREAKQLDWDLRAAARTTIDSLARFAYLIEQAEKRGVWKLVTDAQGKPYKSHHGYITDVLAAETVGQLAPQYRNNLVKVLLESGLSQRAAAEIAKTSKSTVDRIAQGETPGERNVTPRPNSGGAPSGKPQQQANAADRAYDAVDRVVRRAQTYPDDLPIEDVERLISKLKQATTVLNKMVKDYRAAVTEAQKRHPAGGKSASPAA